MSATGAFPSHCMATLSNAYLILNIVMDSTNKTAQKKTKEDNKKEKEKVTKNKSTKEKARANNRANNLGAMIIAR